MLGAVTFSEMKIRPRSRIKSCHRAGSGCEGLRAPEGTETHSVWRQEDGDGRETEQRDEDGRKPCFEEEAGTWPGGLSLHSPARDALNKQDTRERRAPGREVPGLVLECQSSIALRDHLPHPTPFRCPIVQMSKQT